MKLNKYLASLVLILLLNFSFSRSAEQITQELKIEEALKEKVEMAIGNLFVNPNQYVVIVNAAMREKPMDLQSSNNNQSSSPLIPTPSVIPGMPTIPQKIFSQNANSVIQYSEDKFLLYHLKITVYLESTLNGMAKTQMNIEDLIKKAIPDIVDCSDCIFFETMNFEGQTSTNLDIEDLKNKIERLESEKKDAENQIMNWKFDQLEQTLEESQARLSKYQDEEIAHKVFIRNLDSIRWEKSLEIEKLYKQERDSLLQKTAIKLDDAQADRTEHDKEIIDNLLGKMADEGNSENGFTWPAWLTWVLISLLVFGLLVALLFLAMKKRKPIYLKPRVNNAPAINTTDNLGTPSQERLSQANRNSDVKQAELNSIRQSAVTMSVGQKEGATQIVQDWLENDGASEETSDEDNS